MNSAGSSLDGFERFVAIGDRQKEGLYDYHEDGSLRGWADRFTECLSERNPDLLYANLAVRGKRTQEILDAQVEPALALKPDVVSVMSGVNDMIRPGADPFEVAADVECMYRAFAESGAGRVGKRPELVQLGGQFTSSDFVSPSN